MPPTEVIKPSTIARESRSEEEPESPYSWGKQARNQSVERKALVVKNQGINARNRVRKTRGVAPTLL
jgi:hypothetical protein